MVPHFLSASFRSEHNAMRRRPVTSSHHAAGFTMIELVTVIVLLGILAATAIIGFRNMAGIDLQAQSEVLARHIRYAQHMALSTSSVWGIRTAEGGAAYALHAAPVATSAATALPGDDGTPHELERGVTTGTWSVSFDADGVPTVTGDGAQRTAEGWSISLSDGNGDSETLTITEDTGFIP